MSIDGGLRSIFRDHLPGLHWQSIETGGTGRGVPDSNYCLGGFEGWIEYKKTETFEIAFRPEQIGWLCRRARAGGRVRVGVRRTHNGGPRLGAPVDQLWVMDARRADLLRVSGLNAQSEFFMGLWHGGPSDWDWNAVKEILLR